MRPEFQASPLHVEVIWSLLYNLRVTPPLILLLPLKVEVTSQCLRTDFCVHVIDELQCMSRLYEPGYHMCQRVSMLVKCAFRGTRQFMVCY